MNDSGKPFACSVGGCEMTFTNEDHLNWHHKKHDMSLNLGLANKNLEAADQTPTPTRFIRNCEEVGLFQDLQNVNPFDETFKKAIECAKSGTLLVPEAATNDDTLHTPHIFPHVENTVNKYLDNRTDNHSTRSNDFCITTVTSIDEDEDPNESYDLTIDTTETEKEACTNIKQINLKDKLKETIKNKGKNSLVITPVPIEKLIMNKNDNQKRNTYVNDENKKKQRIETNDDSKEKLRAMNRAAQLRCRKRKQIQWKKMEEELTTLKNENAKLIQENQNFKHTFYALKELILKHKRNVPNNNNSLLKKIEEILNSDRMLKRNSISGNVHRIKPQPIKEKPIKSVRSLVPVPVVHSVGPAVQKPVLIQVVGSVAQLAVSVLPNK